MQQTYYSVTELPMELPYQVKYTRDLYEEHRAKYPDLEHPVLTPTRVRDSGDLSPGTCN